MIVCSRLNDLTKPWMNSAFYCGRAEEEGKSGGMDWLCWRKKSTVSLVVQEEKRGERQGSLEVWPSNMCKAEKWTYLCWQILCGIMECVWIGWDCLYIPENGNTIRHQFTIIVVVYLPWVEVVCVDISFYLPHVTLLEKCLIVHIRSYVRWWMFYSLVICCLTPSQRAGSTVFIRWRVIVVRKYQRDKHNNFHVKTRVKGGGNLWLNSATSPY